MKCVKARVASVLDLFEPVSTKMFGALQHGGRLHLRKWLIRLVIGHSKSFHIPAKISLLLSSVDVLRVRPLQVERMPYIFQTLINNDFDLLIRRNIRLMFEG